MSERTITLTLRRSLPTWDFDKHGYTSGHTMIAGAGLLVTVDDDGIEGVGFDPEPSGYDWADALRAAAKEPCEHLYMENDERLGYPDYFDCAKFSAYGKDIIACLGDKCRCPFAVKDEAEKSTSTPEGRPAE